MRWRPRIDQVNAALVALYFVASWGVQACRILTSPAQGLDDRMTALSAVFVHRSFDFGPDGLPLAATVLGAIKLVAASAFAAYLVSFLRGLIGGRAPDSDTLDSALTLGLATVVIWGASALAFGDGPAIRLYATELLLLIGAAVVILVVRPQERPAPSAPAVDPLARLVRRFWLSPPRQGRPLLP